MTYHGGARLERWEDAQVPGVPHRFGGFEPAVVERDLMTGVVTYEAWYKRGKLHRSRGNGPTEIWRASTGEVVQTARGHGRQRHVYVEGPPGTKALPAPYP